MALTAGAVAAGPVPAAGAFAAGATVASAERYGSGHINDTYRVSLEGLDGRRQILLQRLNPLVFPQPEALMANIAAVSSHLAGKLEAEGLPDRERRMLTPIPTNRGAHLVRDVSGAAWRAYEFIPGAVSFDVVTTAQQAREAARAFGRFQRRLLDYQGPELAETLPGFHHTPRRFAAFERAVEADAFERAADCRPEIEQVLARRSLAHRLLDASADIPTRVTHNDTKLNNVLLDEESGEGLCVIDLDTVMPGFSLYDFGDLVRTATRRAPEDETELAKIDVDAELFAAVAQGYLLEMGPHLTPAERRLLVVSGQLITFEVGMRFLTDYLEGDVYFRVHHPDHNLARARSQLTFVAALERRQPELEVLLEGLR